MIDLTQYKELMKCKKHMTKIEKECEKQFRKEFRENPNMTMDRRHEILQPYYNIKDNVYTKMLFDILLELNPVVVEHRTGEHLRFNEVFGEDFETIYEKVKLHIYKMAEESSVIYKFYDNLKRTDEKIIKGGDYLDKENPGYENNIFRNGQISEYGYISGVPKKEWFSLTYEEKEKCEKIFLEKSQREQARYMNENYGMNYNLNDFPDDEKTK